MSSSEEEFDSDAELQEALQEGKLKPGLNRIVEQKVFVNNVGAMKKKLEQMKTSFPWIETLDCVMKQAPLAPELAAQMLQQEEKREKELKNNKKLPQYASSEDPVLNDFKREMIFHRQAQETVLEIIPKLKSMGIPTKRPDDYFAEMAKTDDHMQKIRKHLEQERVQKQASERAKQLRIQRKEGKILQIQNKLQRQQEKKEILNQVKKVRKGLSKDVDFLDDNTKKTGFKKAGFKKAGEKKKLYKDKKFGFGGKKRGLKKNTKDSAEDISGFKRPKGDGRGKNNLKNRPGKNRRIQIRNKKKS